MAVFSASANFNLTGNVLTVILTNTSADVRFPNDVLSAVYFNGNGTLTPASAPLSGGSVVFYRPGVGGDNAATGTAAVTGNFPLIQNQPVFTFSLILISTRSLVRFSNTEQRSLIQRHLPEFRSPQVCSSWGPDFLESHQG